MVGSVISVSFASIIRGCPVSECCVQPHRLGHAQVRGYWDPSAKAGEPVTALNRRGTAQVISASPLADGARGWTQYHRNEMTAHKTSTPTPITRTATARKMPTRIARGAATIHATLAPDVSASEANSKQITASANPMTSPMIERTSMISPFWTRLVPAARAFSFSCTSWSSAFPVPP